MRMRQLACNTCAIRHRAVCGALSDDEILHLNEISIWKHLDAGQVILRDQEEPQYFSNIVSGVVKLTKSLADGRQQIVGLQFPAEFIGRPLRRRSPYFAEAASSVTLCAFDRGRFERLVERFPGLERRLFEHALDELDAARDWMVLLGRKTAGEKVASFLLMVAHRASQVGCSAPEDLASAKFELALSRAEIADSLGLTIETVSRQFTGLRRRGIIELSGAREVFVPDMKMLGQMAEQNLD